jgi:cardiolipin synthase
MNIPNTITIMRMVLVPALVYFLLQGEYRSAILVLVVAGISDALDGFIARRFDICTELGSMLDPLADKLLIIASVLTLALRGLLPLWLAVVIVIRDLIIVGGATVYYRRAGSIKMAPSITSKLNTFILVCLILLDIGTAAGITQGAAWLPVLFGCALLTTVISGVNYILIWGQKGAALETKTCHRPATGDQ